MRITIRQLNGALSAMQSVKEWPEGQLALKRFIQQMLESKKDCTELPDDEFSQAIIELAKQNEILANVQKHNRR